MNQPPVHPNDSRPTTDPRAGFVARAVEWLRAGYPAGVPREDYVVLLGLLRRKLTEVEVQAIADQLLVQADPTTPITRSDIESLVGRSVLQPATAEDVARVSARLAIGGWPLADPPGEGHDLEL